MEKLYTLTEEQLHAFTVKYVTDPANRVSLLATLPTTQSPVVPSRLPFEIVSDPTIPPGYAVVNGEVVRIVMPLTLGHRKESDKDVQIARELFGNGATPPPSNLREAVEAEWWKQMLEAVVTELASDRSRNFPKVWEKEENAPGHAHGEIGIWDSDNGLKAGKPCSWCIAWNAARKALAALSAEVG